MIWNITPPITTKKIPVLQKINLTQKVNSTNFATYSEAVLLSIQVTLLYPEKCQIP